MDRSDDSRNELHFLSKISIKLFCVYQLVSRKSLLSVWGDLIEGSEIWILKFGMLYD